MNPSLINPTIFKEQFYALAAGFLVFWITYFILAALIDFIREKHTEHKIVNVLVGSFGARLIRKQMMWQALFSAQDTIAFRLDFHIDNHPIQISRQTVAIGKSSKKIFSFSGKITHPLSSWFLVVFWRSEISKLLDPRYQSPNFELDSPIFRKHFILQGEPLNFLKQKFFDPWRHPLVNLFEQTDVEWFEFTFRNNVLNLNVDADFIIRRPHLIKKMAFEFLNLLNAMNQTTTGLKESSLRCPFCQTQKQVEENPYAYTMFSSQPVSRGHILVVPKRHVENFFDCSPEEIKAIYELLCQAKELVQENYKPDGFHILVSHGQIEGESFRHTHMHLIPRYQGEELNKKGWAATGLGF